ncbi:SUMF1/EgtB/PvdO family nonheme iron enzyme [Saprospiraceae bacterium]|nr:SUMF1/EgtB/PvdO family nonheme iron enzyme [bacterium]MDA9873550.1 SUMF1/EgtB/PvdO family nonheme iron enzyme [Saprospiraceae bacterium]MDC1508490.1 SUMF1/EgtB/PvdO family nonheme iron enzyme [Saprospiraceae bacterium]
MKRITYSILGIFTLMMIMSSCSTQETGHLTGVIERPNWSGFNPYGMVYVPSGNAHIGQSDQDMFSTYTQRPKSISVQGFFMDDTEITNNEYRQFVYWVRDSIAHTIMGDFTEDEYGNEKIDWEYEIDYSSEDFDEMFYEGDMAFDGQRDFEVEDFIYRYQWLDWKAAAAGAKRNTLIQDEEEPIYPDTLCFIRDFSYSYNEPMTRNYFSHPAFDDYPVVGVNWKQAKAFCHWRTHLLNSLNIENEPNTENFRLPTEVEWEYAARGGHDLTPYPWGGYYPRNAKGCLLANFKPGRGNYPEDGGFYTVKADAYFPNDYGLYCMAGNVSEWTEDAFYENAYTYTHDMNSNYSYTAADDDPDVYKRKVIRGGSWKDIAYYLHTGTRHWEFQDTTKSYIGFRCAVTFLGRSIDDF